MERTKDFLNIISGFGDDWVILRTETDVKSKEVYVHLKYSGQYIDPETYEEATLYDYAPERVWRHLDIWGYKTFVVCSLPRVRCIDGKVKTIRAEWCEPYTRYTYDFEDLVIDTLKLCKNQTRTAEYLRCGFRQVNTIIHRCTERGLERREKNLKIKDISIDEKSFQKGHKYVTVLSNPRSGCVLDVGENRDQKSVTELVTKAFSIKQLEEIETISMDMWKPYINVAKQLMPTAKVVHDKFHLIKYLNESIDKVRRREVKENEVLKNSKYSILKNESNRTEIQEEVFKQVIESNLEVTKVYYARESFKTLFDLENSYEEAKEYFKKWANKYFMYNIKELNKVILMLLSHYEGVIEALISTYTNAMAERLNGKIQEIKLTARGYRTFINFRSAILFFHGGLDLYPLRLQ